MYAAKQNKEKVCRRIDGGLKQRTEQNGSIIKNKHCNILQLAKVGNINCPNIGIPYAIGRAIHSQLERDFIANGSQFPGRPTWIRGAEIPINRNGTGPIPDISFRTPVKGAIRAVGEIKPIGEIVQGQNQLNQYLQNRLLPINDNAWAQNASFPVTFLDPNATSPTGLVNVNQHVPGLYTYYG